MIVLIAVVLVLFVIMVYLIVKGNGKQTGLLPSGRGRGSRKPDFDEEDDEFESFDEDLDEPEPVKKRPAASRQ